MKVSVIIPSYNEGVTLAEVLRKVRAVPCDKEIIVVDDGSTDDTSSILAKEGGHDIKIIYHPNNLGKGAAIRSALPLVTGEVAVIQDADLEYSPSEIPRLIKPIADGQADVVYGSRARVGHSQYLRYWLGSKIISLFANCLYGMKLADLTTGHKVFKTEVLRHLNLKSQGFEFCAEVTAKLARSGCRIVEVPISYFPRTFKEGKKIRWQSGVGALWMLVVNRFNNKA